MRNGTSAYKISPASLNQERLWFLEQLTPGSSAYNVARLFRLSGPLRIDVLEHAFQAVAERHAVLRATFDLENDEVVQVIGKDTGVEFSVLDLDRGSGDDREQRVINIAEREARRAFDLNSGPLTRATLVRMGTNDHALLIVMHHIITDGWSMNILFREIAENYKARGQGRTPTLPELPIPYADFAQWQRDTLNDVALYRHLEYWRTHLAGASGVLPLPFDHSPAPGRAPTGRNAYLQIDEKTSEGLRILSRQSGASLFMTLLAAFQVLLYRYTSTEDIVIGTPTAGRKDPELENLIGFFVNTLIIRGDLSGNPTFREVLRRTREVALQSYEYQDTPFEKIVQDLQPARDANSTPLFQVMFVFHGSASRLQLEGLEVEEVPLDVGNAKFPVTLEIVDGAGLSCTLEYRTDLFSDIMIQRLLANFQRLLNGILENPDCPIAHLPILSPQESRLLISDWNNTSAEIPPQATIHSVFESNAERIPDAPAFVCQAQRLTYRELNRKANQLAWRLIELGLKPQTPVGVFLERSLDVPIAMLAVLKAGAAYVPLDPSYPTQRLAWMLEHCDARLVITHRNLQSRLPAGDFELISVDERLLHQHREDNPFVPLASNSIAYIMYTSGSTGRPKGVSGTHRATLNRAAWMSRTYPFSTGEIICQKTSLSFVDSVWEIFGPALDGVPVVIIPDEIVTSPEVFLNTLSRHDVTRIVVVPSFLRLLLETVDNLQDLLRKLKWCITSGEILPPHLARLFLQKLPYVRLLNLYGSSEVAGDVTYFEVTESDGLSAIPIGRPIANTQIYLLDRCLEPVPAGAHGEIHVAGDCLACGYWHDPELTAARFIPNVMSAQSDTRLFKTGDLGRFRLDGTLEYLGRTDRQVKIRGYRIDPSEIEAALNSHPLVREAVVLGTGTGAHQQLAAYIVPQEGGLPSFSELRPHMKGILPEYMMPSAVTVIERLPLLPNGKVDRISLLSLRESRPAPVAEPRGPRNPTEQQLVQIWREVLNVSLVGIDDNFFEIGGHSLMGMQVISRIRRSFQVEVPLKAIFEQPTIAGLASVIEAARATGAVVAEPLIKSRRQRRNREQILAELNQLSPKEVDDLLKTLTERNRGTS
jgi:amino acid adenylation domain-containing protein